jgi:hypothetical protein
MLALTDTTSDILGLELTLDLVFSLFFSNNFDILLYIHVNRRLGCIIASYNTLPVLDPNLSGMFSPMVVVERSGPAFLPFSSPNLAHFLR